MKDYQALQIRNIGIVGHGGEGKTTLTEAMLFDSGAIDRMGRVEDGNTVSDFDAEETKRTISISASVAPVEWKDHKINVIDVPGFFDFIGEVAGALKVADAAVIVVGSMSGLAVGTEKAWDYCEKYGISRAFFVNQMDKEHANFTKVLGELTEKYGSSVAPVMLPITENAAMTGYINVIENKAYSFGAKQQATEIPVPAALESELASMREALTEAAAGADDELMEKFFEEGELAAEDIIKGLKAGLVNGTVVPVLCGSATTNVGVTTLMDMIVDFMPSPADKGAVVAKNTKTGDAIEIKTDDPFFSAQVFKTVADPFVGKLSLFRIYSGKLASDTPIYNTNAEKAEKVGTIYMMRGKKQIAVDSLNAGDIGAIAKLQYTVTGNTLATQANPVMFDDIEFPAPAISLAVSAKNSKEEDKVVSNLTRLMEEDPTFKLTKDVETGDTLISGLGELHLEVICKKLQNKFGVEVVLNDPKIPYRETIRKSVKAQGRHKKQSGGHGQFGDCWIEFEPIYDGEESFEFVDKVVGGVVPRQYIPAVEKGLRENLPHGVLAGFPVVNLRATLYDGSYHAVDSSEMAFKTAARLAFRKGLSEASPVLLEPIYTFKVNIPDEYMGDIIGDINRRRGRIMGMNPENGMQQVVAEVPMAEMFKYATDLRSMTQGRGSFTSEFVRYEEVPANLAAKIIEQHKKDVEEDE